MMSKISFRMLAVMGLGMVVPASAADYASHGQTSLASGWVKSSYAATRLISAQAAVGPDDSRVLLGFQVDLQPGWKTYWRSPGEAGSPPRWSWGGTTNLSDVSVAWPLPKRSVSFGIDALVYEHQVVMPIALKLTHPGKAVSVDLTVDYFVCQNICVPLQGRYRVDIPASRQGGKPTRDAALIKEYEKRVPAQVLSSHATAPNGVKISGLRLAKSGKNSTLHFDAVGDKSMNKADVFVEGPQDLGFGLPKRSNGKTSTSTHFAVPVYGDGLNVADALAGSPLILTLSDGNGNAAEYRLRVK